MRTTSNAATDAYCDRGIRILDHRQIAAISTLRADGWPQTMLIRYANDGFKVYFRVERNSQKYRNIQHDNRISLAVGDEPDYVPDQCAVFAAAYVHQVTEPEERVLALKLLDERIFCWPQLKKPDERIIMCAVCKYVSVLDGSYNSKRGNALTIDLSTQFRAGCNW